MSLCPDDELEQLVLALRDAIDEATTLKKALNDYPDDPRLVFMMGSVLAGSGDLVNAHVYLSRAVELAPEFAIARFQLGFFELTSGESNQALKTWARLDMLPEEHYLKLFSSGLRHLIRDEFVECVALLERGIASNEENLPLNHDMQLIIERCRPYLIADQDKKSVAQPSVEPEAEAEQAEESATSILLGQLGVNTRKH